MPVVLPSLLPIPHAAFTTRPDSRSPGRSRLQSSVYCSFKSCASLDRSAMMVVILPLSQIVYFPVRRMLGEHLLRRGYRRRNNRTPSLRVGKTKNLCSTLEQIPSLSPTISRSVCLLPGLEVSRGMWYPRVSIINQIVLTRLIVTIRMLPRHLWSLLRCN